MNVLEARRRSAELLGHSISLEGTIASDTTDTWITLEGLNPSDKTNAILIDHANLFLDYLSAVSFLVGGQVAFCQRGRASGTLMRCEKPGFDLSIERPFDLHVEKVGQEIEIDLTQAPFGVVIVKSE